MHSDTCLSHLTVMVDPTCVNSSTTGTDLAMELLGQLEQQVKAFLAAHAIATSHDNRRALEVVLCRLDMAIQHLNNIGRLRNILVNIGINDLASGLATTLHFVYPVLVVVACIAFRYERANRRKLVCCALCFAGILCFYTPGGDVSAYGVFLALASGVAWAYYIVHLNSSGLVTMAPFKLAFWLCVFSAVLVGGITLAMGEFVWPSTAFTRGALALYCCVSTAASLLFQLGNRFIGAQSASMLSTFEPLTSVVIGILVYHEVLTVRLGIGIFCILLAVFLLAKADGTVKEETKSEA